jgi:hypothetical protein
MAKKKDSESPEATTHADGTPFTGQQLERAQALGVEPSADVLDPTRVAGSMSGHESDTEEEAIALARAVGVQVLIRGTGNYARPGGGVGIFQKP